MITQEIHEKTQRAFNELKEGDIFTEKLQYFVIVAIVRKNLVIIYQGTEGNMEPFCYEGIEQVRAKFANAAQSGFWVTYFKNDKEYSDKILNG